MSDYIDETRAEEIGNAIVEIACKIDSAHWVRTGRYIPAEDKMPEIVAAVIYVLNYIDSKKEKPHD